MEITNVKTKEKLIHCFLVMSQAKPIHVINVKDLCMTAGVSRTTFYRFFDSIYDLAEELEQKHINDFLEIARLHEKNKTSMEKYMREILGYIQKEEPYFKSALSEHADQHFVYQWKKVMIQDVMKEYRYSEKNLDASRKLALEMMISGVIGAYTYWLFHPEQISFEVVLHWVLRIWEFYKM